MFKLTTFSFSNIHKYFSNIHNYFSTIHKYFSNILILKYSPSRERLVHLLAVRAQKKMELHNRIYKGNISIKNDERFI